MTVLVVDDVSETAESVAALIRSKTGLQVHFESVPDSALTYAVQNRLTVLVLDEEMPQMTGTQLWANVKPHQPYAAALMLTQERGDAALQKAMRLGYKEHLWKHQIDELPDKVLNLHLASVSLEAVTNAERQLVMRRRRLFGCSPEIWLIARTTTDERFIADDWQDYVSIEAGQTRKATQQIRSTFQLVLEDETTESAKLSLSAGLKFADLKPSLEEALVTRSKTSETRSTENVQALEVTYSLPAEVADPEGNLRQLRSRSFEYAHVFKRERIVLEKYCPDCGVRAVQSLMVRYPLDMIALRQSDFFSDSHTAVVQTGFRRVPFERRSDYWQ